VVYADGTRANYELDRIQTNEDKQQRSSGVIDLFVESILTGKKTVLDAADIVHSMRVVFACLESAESGRIVEL
jgi:predicted dehydrogenase